MADEEIIAQEELMKDFKGDSRADSSKSRSRKSRDRRALSTEGIVRH
jgi:hypothetical protein